MIVQWPKWLKCNRNASIFLEAFFFKIGFQSGRAPKSIKIPIFHDIKNYFKLELNNIPMKNLFVLLAFVFITAAAQSQSMSEKEISGTWQVTAIADAGSNPDKAAGLDGALFDLYPDHRFQLRLKRGSGTSVNYEETFQNATWSYNANTQTITAGKGMKIKVSKIDNKVFFELLDTGVTYEVYQPV
tara:strand:+ start:564 stop:1121 length:558 start_codon:yes stop_codon:yes gene_type:complete